MRPTPGFGFDKIEEKIITVWTECYYQKIKSFSSDTLNVGKSFHKSCNGGGTKVQYKTVYEHPTRGVERRK